MNVLIVDDEPLVLQGLSSRVRAVLGPYAEISTANTDAQALELVRLRAPELVFLDVEMPGMSGMELGARIKQLLPKTELIFITAYPQYSLPAWRVRATDFLLKPVNESDIREALSNLRNPERIQPPPDPDRLQVQCFGNFEVFWRGKILHFPRTRSKELFAYLISRRGAGVTAGELCSVLWEDDGDINLKKSYIRTYFSALRKTLSQCGMEGAALHIRNSYAVNPDLLDCDYYRFLNLEPAAINSYQSEFMSQYSWAERLVYHIEASLSERPTE